MFKLLIMEGERTDSDPRLQPSSRVAEARLVATESEGRRRIQRLSLIPAQQAINVQMPKRDVQSSLDFPLWHLHFEP